MSPAGLKNKGFLDPKTCWKVWHSENGSLSKVQDKMIREGNINYKTGRVATKSGIEKAAFMWAIKNQAEARKDLEKAWASEGFPLTDEAWKQFLAGAGRLVFYQRKNSLKEFIEENNLQDYCSL